MSSYWLAENISAVESANSFSDLLAIAFEVIDRMPQPVGQVCGPISSGGLGSIEKNIEVMTKAITALTAQGKSIFNQMPFEGPMQRLKGENNQPNNLHLLSDFYLPLFKSGKIKMLYFLPNWQSSHGATWEHEQAVQLGIPIIYLDESIYK